jgi:hypothetical protein
MRASYLAITTCLSPANLTMKQILLSMKWPQSLFFFPYEKMISFTPPKITAVEPKTYKVSRSYMHCSRQPMAIVLISFSKSLDHKPSQADNNKSRFKIQLFQNRRVLLARGWSFKSTQTISLYECDSRQ